MALDPNIALGVRPIEIANPLAQYGQIAQLQAARNQNQLAQYQLGAAQRAEQTATTQNELYAKHFNPETGGLNVNLLVEEAAKRGQGGIIPGILKSENERLKAAADLNKVKTETTGLEFEQRIKKANKAISDIASLETPEQAIASIDAHLAKGDIDQSKADMLKGRLSKAPSFGKWQNDMLAGILGEKDKLERVKPKPVEVKRADGSIVFLDQNPDSPTFNQEVMTRQASGMTPYEKGRLAREDQRLAQEATSVVYQTDNNGNVVALPSKLRAGEVPTGRTAVAPGGGFQPMMAKPSEAEGKEQMSINQQRAIVKGAMDAVAQTPDAFGYTAGSMPESLRGRMASPEENTNRSYLFNVVSGVIKERAGTAQSAAEAQTLARFLPTETDNADIIKSKLQGFDKYLTDKEAGTSKKRPGGPTNPTLAPMDQQALQWANSNPGDPRAAAIKQRLGQ